MDRRLRCHEKYVHSMSNLGEIVYMFVRREGFAVSLRDLIVIPTQDAHVKIKVLNFIFIVGQMFMLMLRTDVPLKNPGGRTLDIESSAEKWSSTRKSSAPI